MAYADSEWATCIKTKTRRSFTGVCIFLSGGVIAYKTQFQPTVALLSTKAEFMAACDAGRMCLFIRSILWDLNIPQEAATIGGPPHSSCQEFLCSSSGNIPKRIGEEKHKKTTVDLPIFNDASFCPASPPIFPLPISEYRQPLSKSVIITVRTFQKYVR